jgi:hypothetical protein
MAWIRNRPVGLVYRDPAQTRAGYTLFCSVRGHTAWLLDADGRLVHRWHHPEGIEHAQLIGGGRLLIHTQPPEDADGAEQIGGSSGAIVELDWESNVVWEYRDRFLHHDYERLPNGNTLLLRWEKLPADVQSRVQGGFHHRDDPERMWADVVQVIDPRGKVLHEWRSWEHLDAEEEVLCPLESRKEWTHANSIEVLPDGSWLISFRLTSSVVVVDRTSGEVTWRWGPGFLSHQHAATRLANGNFLIFDNGCHRRRMPSFSQVVELDPERKEVVWSYVDPTVLAFFSFMVSGAERLANGNTLITEGATGRIFEVTPERETVWEYVSPFLHLDPRFGPTPAVFRAHRYEADDPRLAGRNLAPGRHAALEARIAPGGLPVGEE